MSAVVAFLFVTMSSPTPDASRATRRHSPACVPCCRSPPADDTPVTSTERGPSAAFLHGTLDVTVVEARKVEGPKGKNMLKRLERAITSSTDGVDPYCSVKLGYNKVMQTPVIQNNSSPVWNSTASFDVCHELDALEFRIKAAKRSGPLAVISKVQHLSMLKLSAHEIKSSKKIQGWFPLQPYESENVAETLEDETDTASDDEKAAKLKEKGKELQLGELHLLVVYTPVTDNPFFDKIAVPNSYFPARKGCVVKLYQDADCPPGSLPVLPFRPDYKPNRCFLDMAKAIAGATQLIYITGWSVWTDLSLIRTDFPGDDGIIPHKITLGELLKRKADEGVTVCVMVWDEFASGNFVGISSEGMMGTHDEQLVSYFANTKVQAIKVGRLNPKDGPFADLNDNLLFTHHQKTVIVSTRDPSGSGKHRLQAFVGGLDLTNGRYDNNSHHLFRSLKTLHAQPDFWQACAQNVSPESGPREPWHDIHSFVTGTAAWDVLANFEGRWKRQAPENKKSELHPRPAENFVIPSEESNIGDGDWCVQVLRSISEASTTLDNDRPGLVSRRLASVDQSIHHAYCHQIRRARSFIYVENQYFLGSSHLWDSGQRGGFASHLVPIELAEKICAKIRANERFAVYVTIPMFPEGIPDSAAVQEILSHQRKTVALITTRIASTIKETGSDTKVTDWFNIFCLVNRESKEGDQGSGGGNENEAMFSASRRFMIYVHSKFACFDDTAAIIGSANINR